MPEDCTHNLCSSSKYDDGAASPLLCPGGFGDLAPEFFSSLGAWQKRYGRDNLQLSEYFLEDVFRLHVEPALSQGLERCPAAVLEIMMNGLLALETRAGVAAAKAFLLRIYRLRDEVLLAAPPGDEAAEQLRQLMAEWNADIAHVYPKLLGIERLGPNETLPHGELQEGAVDDPRLLGAADPDWCLGQRFYVYQLPDASLYSPGTLSCVQGQWGTEVLMFQYLKHNCNTLDPEKADWFYVPLYSTCRYVHLGANASDEGEMMADLDLLSNRHIWSPLVEFLRSSVHYHRNQGRDHIFLFADGQGPRIWDSYDLLRSESVFLSPESMCPTWGEPVRRYVDVKPCLSSWKDVVIPGHTDYARIQYMKARNRPSAERRLLMTFHGRGPGTHGAYAACAVRGLLLQLGERLGLERGVDVGGFVGDYLERKGDSHFCLVPAGTSPWTNHLYESFYTGCVPVILSDEYAVAFLDELPWERFSIRWPESRICSDQGCTESALYRHLHRLVVEDPGRLWRMKRELERHSCYFNWYSTDASCSPYFLVQRRLRRLLERRPPGKRYWNADGAAPADGSEHFLHLERPTRFKNFANETSNFSWLSSLAA